jgi:hypothetical protein
VDDTFAFTVLLPTRPTEAPEFLAEALASLFASSVAPAAVMVCTDAPLPPALSAVVATWPERVRVEVSPSPGLPQSLNHAARRATTPWLARMDADDINLPGRFAAQIAYLADNPTVDVLGGSILEFWPDGRTRRRRVPTAHADIVRMAAWRNPMNHMTVMMRRASLLACGGYPEMGAKEDYGLWLRLIGAGAVFANLPDDLVQARLGWGFTQRRSGARNLASEWRLYRMKRGIPGLDGPRAVLALLARTLSLASRGGAGLAYWLLRRGTAVSRGKVAPARTRR